MTRKTNNEIEILKVKIDRTSKHLNRMESSVIGLFIASLGYLYYFKPSSLESLTFIEWLMGGFLAWFLISCFWSFSKSKDKLGRYYKELLIKLGDKDDIKKTQ